uniref:Zinc finger matrin-type 4 n=1 Tax=Chrysemys picta bellii TaxID=8478 RepID=A0A8C3FCJ9_CHRPI
MKSSDIDQELFTESYCKVCSAQLISESQRVAHYESRKHASKVRLYYMLHPIDGGCPAKKLRSENGSDADAVDKNKCCTLCNMSFTSAVVAESHYQGKIHAKRLKLLLGEQPALKATGRSKDNEYEETLKSRIFCPFRFMIIHCTKAGLGGIAALMTLPIQKVKG